MTLFSECAAFFCLEASSSHASSILQLSQVRSDITSKKPKLAKCSLLFPVLLTLYVIIMFHIYLFGCTEQFFFSSVFVSTCLVQNDNIPHGVLVYVHITSHSSFMSFSPPIS